MGRTVDESVAQIRRRIEGRTRFPVERLNGAVTTTSETVVIEFGDRNVVNGTFLEVDYEILQVYDATSSPSLSCFRAMEGGGSAATLADNSSVRIDPRVFKQECLDELKHTIDDLPDNVFATTTVDVTFSADVAHTELTGAAGKEVLWARAERDPAPSSAFGYRTVGLGVFANDAVTSGWILQIDQGASYESAQTLEITYGHRFDTSTFASATDLESTVGIPKSMLATIEYGAIARLMAGEEIQRNTVQSQGQPRRAEEVPPGMYLELSREWQRRFEAGLAREASRLRRQYPIIEKA